jgi:intergrase/recombinase
LKALAALSKFLGVHEEFKKLIQDFGLKWGGRSADDLIIDRLTKAENPGEIFEWIARVKQGRPELSDFLDFMAITGLRMIEAVESYNLIIKLAHQRKIKDYYNAEKQTLEHFKFKEKFLRKSKKAFISFISWQMVQTISEQTPVTLDMIRKRVQKQGLPLRFSDIREAHGTLLTKHLKDAEVDFLEGRVANSVFMRNYFNPALIVDLEARAFQGIAEIQQKVKA